LIKHPKDAAGMHADAILRGGILRFIHEMCHAVMLLACCQW
jgi:hypothetical protein